MRIGKRSRGRPCLRDRGERVAIGAEAVHRRILQRLAQRNRRRGRRALRTPGEPIGAPLIEGVKVGLRPGQPHQRDDFLRRGWLRPAQQEQNNRQESENQAQFQRITRQFPMY